MATTVNHRFVNPARNPLAFSDSSQSRSSKYNRHHDLYRHPAESTSQVSTMSGEDLPLDFSRTLTTGSDGWSKAGDGDGDDESSVTSDTSHARIARRLHFPPVLPSVNSSSSISKSLPQKLAATISAVEGAAIPNLDQHHPKLSKSQSPPVRFRRVKSPLPPPSAQKGSLLSSALRARHPPDSQIPSNRSNTPSSRQTQPTPHDDTHEIILGRIETPNAKGFTPDPHIWHGLEVGSEDGDDDMDNQSVLGSFDEDEDEDDDDYDMSSRASHNLRGLTERYSRLRNQRTVLWELFDGIRSKRSQVQDLRHVKDRANLAFMTAVQAILPNNQELDQLFKNMQDAQLMCQAAEHSFDDMLDELQHGEIELEREERKFYTAAADVDNTTSEEESDDDDNLSQTSDNSALRGITGDRPEDIHPLFEELREASRNIQLARELLINTQMKRKALSTSKSHLLSADSIDLLEKHGNAGKKRALELKRLGVMSKDDLEMLQEYDNLEQRALFDIDHYTEEAKRLENECRKKGVIPKNTPFQQEGFGFNPIYRDDIHLGDGPVGRPSSREYPQALAHPKFPKLLSNPTHLLQSPPMTAQQQLRLAISLPPDTPSRQKHIDDAAREVNIHLLLKGIDDGDKVGYINRWLLHKLHMSPIEAELLWSTFHVRLKILNIDRWQQDVLHLWWQDQAANLPRSQFEGVYEDRSSASINPGMNLPSRRFSDSGQLDRIRSWDVDKAWS